MWDIDRAHTFTRNSDAWLLSATEASYNKAFNIAESGDMDALSHLIDKKKLDLRLFESEKGYTLLHLATSLGHEDIVQMLLRRVGHDSSILNARDRQGFTPLMTAAATGNVNLMRMLVCAGARANDAMSPPLGGDTSEADRVLARAEILVEAAGDVSNAFERATGYRNCDAAQLYFRAENLSIVQRNAHYVSWLINHAYILAADVLSALDNAVQSHNQAATVALIQPDVVWSTITAMAGQPVSERLAALTSFMSAGADTEHWVGEAVARFMFSAERLREPSGAIWGDGRVSGEDLDLIRMVIDVGAPSTFELARLGERGLLGMAQRLIGFGADPIAAMNVLRETNEGAANGIAYAGLKSLVYRADLSDEERISKLRALMQAGASTVVSELLVELSKTGTQDAVRLLEAAVSTD